MAKNSTIYEWADRKRNFLGLPWSFTRYRLTKDKLMIITGCLSEEEEEIRLYRIMDLTLKRNLWQKLIGCGTIHCCSGDKTAPEFEIKRIKNSRKVKELLSDLVEDARQRRNVNVQEFIQSMDACDLDTDAGDTRKAPPPLRR